ncbi:phage tail protein I [Pseudomonas aeruginosa]|uniref:phage tail protein I n=1 Tax=Pseudomonas aeruginosa TaxID=287 RepID=UPI00204324CE|nr:phage tail protein I [Pseudomonas aeruginosa]HBN7642434.1 phage tail protein I [Pseudomonas aeruginosa]HBN7783248.1 phage tail protein I [Pseudomonas aeruginosa]HBN7804119.1 phage tail protein I [Pseudomonas aeruginosa]HBN7838170.1 phage tail protein I [Pseudomonas aeruginosa]
MSDQPSLLPPNASPLERKLEQATLRLGTMAVPLRELWNPETCPANLLPWLAWTLSLDSWQPYWPEAVKRARIRSAVDIQRRKGTAKSVRDVVRSFGSSLALREWWQKEPMGTPHTFEVVLTLGASVPNTAAYQQDIIKEIERTKPVRSHFTLTLGLAATGGLGLQGAARPVIYRRLQCTEAP